MRSVTDSESRRVEAGLKSLLLIRTALDMSDGVVDVSVTHNPD